MSIERPIHADDPFISVVVPTLPMNDHSKIIRHLRRQTFNSYEVLIVNDADLDICEARNEGIRRAAGDVVALTDDDCRPKPNWLRLIWEEFEANPRLACLEGSVSGGRTYDGIRRYVGCNLAFDRKEAIEIGCFRSEYAGWRDDTEFGWRMELEAEGDCQFSSAVQMRHPDLPRASIDLEIEKLLKREYSEIYRNVLVPDTVIGKINDWLWRNGIWDTIDKVRYKDK